MLTTKRKPASVGEILIEEFMEPMGLTQVALAEAMGVQRKELCNDRRTVTAPTALMLARVFGNSPDFWLNGQRRSDLWEATHSPRERKRIKPCSTPDSRVMCALTTPAGPAHRRVPAVWRPWYEVGCGVQFGAFCRRRFARPCWNVPTPRP